MFTAYSFVYIHNIRPDGYNIQMFIFLYYDYVQAI